MPGKTIFMHALHRFADAQTPAWRGVVAASLLGPFHYENETGMENELGARASASNRAASALSLASLASLEAAMRSVSAPRQLRLAPPANNRLSRSAGNLRNKRASLFFPLFPVLFPLYFLTKGLNETPCRAPLARGRVGKSALACLPAERSTPPRRYLRPRLAAPT